VPGAEENALDTAIAIRALNAISAPVLCTGTYGFTSGSSALMAIPPEPWRMAIFAGGCRTHAGPQVLTISSRSVRVMSPTSVPADICARERNLAYLGPQSSAPFLGAQNSTARTIPGSVRNAGEPPRRHR
jgi:hypothetical protein